MESAELIAILREVRERVRARNPETSAGVDVALPDLLPLLHARDAALGKVAAIGTVNPRSGGLLNALVQGWKRLVSRMLDWHVREQVEFNRKMVACADAALEVQRETNRALSEMGGRVAEMGERVAAMGNRVAEMGQYVDATGDRLKERDEATRKLLAETAAGLHTRLAELEQANGEMRDMRTHWAQWRVHWEQALAQNEMQFLRSVADLQGAFQHRVTLMESGHRELMRIHNTDFHAALERHGFDIQKRLWADLAKMHTEVESIIHSELRLIRQRAQIATVAPAPPEAPATALPSSAEAPALAFDYARFAERFRGPEEYVQAGQQIYLPYFQACHNVLDIGCGRGEFLQMMRTAGVPARGIELSQESVGLCQSRGLDAEVADAFAYLAALPEASLDGIFCSQVVEHLPPERLPELIRACGRALAPGGVIALETPNPECLAIFATHFYLDPTHRHPVPHGLLIFYLEEFGMGNIEVHRLSPARETMPALDTLPAEFREAFFGALDYGVIGRKLA